MSWSTVKKKSVIIREYSPNDKSKIEKLAKSAFNGSSDAYWSVVGLERSDKTLVAEYNNEIVGVIEIEILTLNRERHGHIGYIFVHPKYQKRGIGSLLLEKALSYLKEKNVKTVWALTSPSNKPTRNLFHKFQFEEIYNIKELRKFLSGKAVKKLLRRMVYWSGDIILKLNL